MTDRMHTRDADCAAAGTVDSATGDCTACGVVGCRDDGGTVVPPCGSCDGERFHAAGCPESDEVIEQAPVVTLVPAQSLTETEARRDRFARRLAEAMVDQAGTLRAERNLVTIRDAVDLLLSGGR